MRNVFALLLIGCSLSSCAVASDYWRKPTKYKAMPDRADRFDPEPAVVTLSLDASRRLVLSQKSNRLTGGPRFTCPEPPPDVATNILAQSLLTLQTKAGTNLSAGSAYQVIAQAIHARTSTVEVWRTTSSMYCVLLMNGMNAEAKAYLDVGKIALGATKDTTVTTPAAAAFIDGLIASATKITDKQAADEKAAEAKAAAAKAEEDKKKAKDVEDATLACAKIAEADKPGNADCKKVEEAKKAAAGN